MFIFKLIYKSELKKRYFIKKCNNKLSTTWAIMKKYFVNLKQFKWSWAESNQTYSGMPHNGPGPSSSDINHSIHKFGKRKKNKKQKKWMLFARWGSDHRRRTGICHRRTPDKAKRFCQGSSSFTSSPASPFSSLGPVCFFSYLIPVHYFFLHCRKEIIMRWLLLLTRI